MSEDLTCAFLELAYGYRSNYGHSLAICPMMLGGGLERVSCWSRRFVISPVVRLEALSHGALGPAGWLLFSHFLGWSCQTHDRRQLHQRFLLMCKNFRH